MKKVLGALALVLSSLSLASCGEATTNDEMMISVYLEGSSNNKAIEIYNNGDKDVSLNNYSLGIYKTNEEAVNKKISLSGTIKSKGVYVIANDAANEDILSKSDLKTADLSFSGAPGIALMKNDEVVDVVGGLGNRNQNADTTFVRKLSRTTPRTTFNQYDWLVYQKDNSLYLGSFVNSVTEEELIAGPKFDDKYLEKAFANTSGTSYLGTGGAVEVKLEKNVDGDTSYFIFPDSVDVVKIADKDNYYKTATGYACKVRYQDVDTPETYTENIEKFGWPAKLNTAAIQNAAEKIYVQSVCNDSIAGTFGRILSYVFVKNSDGTNTCVNFETIKKGYSTTSFLFFSSSDTGSS